MYNFRRLYTIGLTEKPLAVLDRIRIRERGMVLFLADGTTTWKAYYWGHADTPRFLWIRFIYEKGDLTLFREFCEAFGPEPESATIELHHLDEEGTPAFPEGKYMVALELPTSEQLVDVTDILSQPF